VLLIKSFIGLGALDRFLAVVKTVYVVLHLLSLKPRFVQKDYFYFLQKDY